MIVALLESERVIASDELIKNKYKCPKCNEDVILKKGKVKIPHFAHKHNSECKHSNGETAQHLKAKMAIYNKLKEDGVEVYLEFQIKDIGRISDVFFVKGDQMTAIEIQHSPQSAEKTQERTKSYNEVGISLLWVVPSISRVENLKVKVNAMEKEFHKMHCGTIFSVCDDGNISPCHYKLESRWIVNDNMPKGGYQKAYKTYRRQTFNDIFNIVDLNEYKNRDGQLVLTIPYKRRWW